jgi:hypothetical protein
MTGRSSRTRRATIANQAKADDFARGLAPILSEMQDQGMSLRSMAASLTHRGITARFGGVWSASSVKRVIARVAGR